ncbi:MAG: 16S rRNA (adenine(1518)-N(6)/adenine(1519)-N(6))-dimethyltransferase RsmA [Propionibacteriaceae bacterium]|jgi:16S rRNA (adenine1518-N6/adenine1519-N6)-dimethyltransferase|nr:16S rRNA (adenine(1518)-N(6)/adenine(1519)-N(6))-dimethyltransferase RsmA [Propionibacteriaceae bacterium]
MASGELLGAADVRALADSIGLKPSKQRGQNFVHDANTVRRIVGLAGVGEADTVLEVGPGLGSLTLGLLESGASVVAVEIDERLAGLLPQTVAEKMPDARERLTVITKDALKLEASDLTGAGSKLPTALVANLPYNVSVPVILHVLEQFPSVKHGLVMVQLEVAERLVAAPGSRTYGVPSVKLAWYASSKIVGTVPKNVFWPVPHIESGLVEFVRHEPPNADREQVFSLIDRAFSNRRKMLRSVLGLAPDVFERAGVDPTARGETLGIDEFVALAGSR